MNPSTNCIPTKAQISSIHKELYPDYFVRFDQIMGIDCNALGREKDINADQAKTWPEYIFYIWIDKCSK